MGSRGDRDWISGRVGESGLLGYGTWRRGYHTERAPQNVHGSLNKCSEGLQDWPRAADGWVGSWEELMGLWRGWAGGERSPVDRESLKEAR